MTNLSDLPNDLLVNIAKKLKKVEDFTCFRCVSKSLLSAAKEDYFEGLRLRQRTPYLMLPVRDGEGSNGNDVREFYSLVEGESIVASVKVAKFKNKKCLESLGWLMVSEKDGSMSLLDPFTGTEIPLPHQNTFPGYSPTGIAAQIFIHKMVLSARPNETSDFVLMVICGGLGHLAFWRLGDTVWNKIHYRNGRYRDVVYHGGGQFVAFGNPCTVRIFNLNLVGNDNQIESHVVTHFAHEGLTTDYETYFRNPLVDLKRIYILKAINDSLLIVTRSARDLRYFAHEGLSYITRKFQVYEIEIATGTWKEIHSLGSMALFLGHNSSFAMDASRLPAAGVIKANRIYFTDDSWEFYTSEEAKGGGTDHGVYNFETGTIEPVYPGEPLLSKVSPSTWITPCF